MNAQMQNPYLPSYVPRTPTSAAPSYTMPNYLEQLGVDPVTKQADAIKELAAAIRELADVLYHIGTGDD